MSRDISPRRPCILFGRQWLCGGSGIDERGSSLLLTRRREAAWGWPRRRLRLRLGPLGEPLVLWQKERDLGPRLDHNLGVVGVVENAVLASHQLVAKQLAGEKEVGPSDAVVLKGGLLLVSTSSHVVVRIS